jgi:hypothetical protein
MSNPFVIGQKGSKCINILGFAFFWGIMQTPLATKKNNVALQK